LGEDSPKLATTNLTPTRSVYGESLIEYDGVEYRLWDPFRSKIAAAILKGLKVFPIRPEIPNGPGSLHQLFVVHPSSRKGPWI